jgi:hypothetical protein
MALHRAVWGSGSGSSPPNRRTTHAQLASWRVLAYCKARSILGSGFCLGKLAEIVPFLMEPQIDQTIKELLMTVVPLGAINNEGVDDPTVTRFE